MSSGCWKYILFSYGKVRLGREARKGKAVNDEAWSALSGFGGLR